MDTRKRVYNTSETAAKMAAYDSSGTTNATVCIATGKTEYCLNIVTHPKGCYRVRDQRLLRAQRVISIVHALTVFYPTLFVFEY